MSIRATLPPADPHLKHLVIVRTCSADSPRELTPSRRAQVPGHAIWRGCSAEQASRATTDSDWILEDLQKGGDVRTYIKHITKGFVPATCPASPRFELVLITRDTAA